MLRGSPTPAHTVWLRIVLVGTATALLLMIVAPGVGGPPGIGAGMRAAYGSSGGMSLVSTPSAVHLTPKRVIAFSLFAYDGQPARPQDVLGFVMNMAEARRWYNDWTVRVFMSDGLPPELVSLVRDLGAEVRIRPQAEVGQGKAMFWRFAAVDEPDVDVFISRDLDSRLSPRERSTVDAWLASGIGFHSIRDHKYHMAKFQGGMWGARRDAMRGALHDTVAATTMAFWDRTFAGKPAKLWGADQDFLNNYLWRRVKSNTLAHCEFNCVYSAAQQRSILPPQASEFFIGGRVKPSEMLDCPSPPQCGFQAVPSVAGIAAVLITTTEIPTADGCHALTANSRQQRSCLAVESILLEEMPDVFDLSLIDQSKIVNDVTAGT